jgi:hypothetical protein
MQLHCGAALKAKTLSGNNGSTSHELFLEGNLPKGSLLPVFAPFVLV